MYIWPSQSEKQARSSQTLKRAYFSPLNRYCYLANGKGSLPSLFLENTINLILYYKLIGTTCLKTFTLSWLLKSIYVCSTGYGPFKLICLSTDFIMSSQSANATESTERTIIRIERCFLLNIPKFKHDKDINIRCYKYWIHGLIVKIFWLAYSHDVQEYFYNIVIKEISSEFCFIGCNIFKNHGNLIRQIQSEINRFQQQYTQVKRKSISKPMSLQKSLITRPSLKNASQSKFLLYRVRNLSRNRSLKELTPINKQRNDLHLKIQRKYTADTSFFAKENLDSIHIQSQQQLPKYSIIKTQNQKPKILKRTSHRILRKVNTCKALPQNIPENIEIDQNITSEKQPLNKVQPRKVSLKKKVQNIMKMHNQNKSDLLQQQFNQVKSEQVLGQKRKSKSKLKILVRDPFHLIKSAERKKTEFPMLQSKIQHINDTSMLSESNRQQIEQFLSCLN